VVLLIALAIVAVLSQTLLKRMGLLPDDRVVKAGPRAPGGTGAAPVDATVSAPTPTNAVERAKGLEGSMQQQSQDMMNRIDSQTK
jgi:hypothetical protein